MSQLARRPGNYGGAGMQHTVKTFSKVGALILFTVLFLCATCAGHSAGETPAHFLSRHGIALTKEGLIAALSNSDVWIRLGAGQQLVLDGDKDAIPFIQAAVAREPRLVTRLTLAFDLAQLGDQSGVDLLKAACTDPSDPPDERVFAARSLLYLHSDTCVSDVLSILDSNIDPPQVIQALGFFSGFNHVWTSEASKKKEDIVAHLVKRLGDEDAGVRSVASDALCGIGGISGAAALKEAVEREDEASLKRQMQADLACLADKPR